MRKVIATQHFFEFPDLNSEIDGIYFVSNRHKKSNTIRCWTFCIEGGFERRLLASVRWTLATAVARPQASESVCIDLLDLPRVWTFCIEVDSNNSMQGSGGALLAASSMAATPLFSFPSGNENANESVLPCSTITEVKHLHDSFEQSINFCLRYNLVYDTLIPGGITDVRINK